MQIGSIDTYSLEYSTGTDNSAYLQYLGENRFQFMDEPSAYLFAETDEEIDLYPKFKDVISAEILDEKRLRFIEVVEKSKFELTSLILSKEQVSEINFDELFREIDKIGGYAERIMGGVMNFQIPVGSDFKLNEKLKLLGINI